MRTKYWLLICISMVCLSWVSFVYAQDDIWRAWLYEETEGRMTLINSEQQVLDTFILPKPAGFEGYTYPYNVAVAPTGDRVAYVLMAFNEARILLVYHLYNKNFMLQYTIAAPSPGVYTGTSLNTIAQPEVFSSDGRYLAFSYFFDESWALLVFDTQTGMLTHSTTNNMVGMPSYQGAIVTPVPVYFDIDAVHVIFVPMATGGSPTTDSYRWQYMSNTMTQTNIFLNSTHDIEPRTREVIFPFLDPKFPDRTDEIIGMGVHQNTIQVYSPTILDAPFPFYSDVNNIIASAWFMQNGERVLVSTYPLASEGYNGVYIVANRSGTIQGILPYQGVWLYNVFSVRDGLVFNIRTQELAPYITFVQGMDTTAVVYIDTVNFPVGTNAGAVLYLGDDGKYPRLVWVGDTVSANPPSPNAWAMLKPAIVDNPSNNQPPFNPPPPQPPVTSITPTPVSGIFVGGQARVTTQVEFLNVRSSPTTSATKLNELPPLTIVNVVGGPQYAQGYTWWQINIGTLTGWVASGTGNQVWLEPFNSSTLPPPPPPVVATPLPAPILYEPQPFEVFTLNQINPPGTGTIISIAFEWQTLAGASTYFLQIQKCNDNGDNCQPIFGEFFNFPSHFFDITQYGYGTYRWRAFGVDMQGNQGAPSDWSYFRYQMN